MRLSLSKIAIIVLGVFLVMALGLLVFKKPAGLFLTKQFVERQMQRDLLAELPDGLHIGFCGTGSPMADPTRAGPCVFVIAGKRIFVVDSGTGSTRNLGLIGVPIGDIEAALLTHYHSDHIADLGELMLQHWVGGTNDAPLPVYGPPGIERVVEGFNAAYRLDQGYRTAHHGEEIAPSAGAGGAPRAVEIGEERNAAAVVLEEDGLKITMFRVDHDPVDPAVGYRFDYRGRSVVITGDTDYTESIIEHARDADILAHEALQPTMVNGINEAAARQDRTAIEAITRDILDYHASPEEAARMAQAAGAGRLVFYHVIPPLPSRFLYAAYLGDAPALFDGPITVAEDGVIFILPAEGIKVRKQNKL